LAPRDKSGGEKIVRLFASDAKTAVASPILRKNAQKKEGKIQGAYLAKKRATHVPPKSGRGRPIRGREKGSRRRHKRPGAAAEETKNRDGGRFAQEKRTKLDVPTKGKNRVGGRGFNNKGKQKKGP